MWDLPGPGLEPVSPALAGGLPTTGPPGKPGLNAFDEVNSILILGLDIWFRAARHSVLLDSVTGSEICTWLNVVQRDWGLRFLLKLKRGTGSLFPLNLNSGTMKTWEQSLHGREQSWEMERDQILENLIPWIKFCLKTDRPTTEFWVLWVNKCPSFKVVWVSLSTFATQIVPTSTDSFQI